MTDNSMSFEQAMEQLEKDVKVLESGELSLDDVLRIFEEGIGLVKTCYEKLNDVEQKIEVLLTDLAETQNIEGRMD